MSENPQTSNLDATSRATESTIYTPPTPLRCLIGAVVAGALAFALYTLTSAIAESFATNPIESANLTVHRISAAVRTLVVGMAALGTGIFGMATVGLFGLAVQLMMQSLGQGKPSSTPPTDS